MVIKKRQRSFWRNLAGQTTFSIGENATPSSVLIDKEPHIVAALSASNTLLGSWNDH